MICFRLKEERERLGLTQPVFAEIAGAKKRTVIDWEKGVSSPTAVQLSALSAAGLDVLYVITGQRSSTKTVAERPPLNDRERLALAIEIITKELSDAGRKLPPHKLTQLILAAYDLMTDPIQSKKSILQLIGGAA